MAKNLSSERLNRISKTKKAVIVDWKEGVSLERDTGMPIQNILLRVATARWRLAVLFKKQGDQLMAVASPLYRSAISRYYYSMYHAVRACVYLENEGDDHEKHSELPTHIPTTLGPGVNWQSKLKNARLTRNSADYDAYPKAEKTWKTKALDIKSDARDLMSATKTFLINKGCAL